MSFIKIFTTHNFMTTFKKALGLIAIFTILLVGFYFWGSSGFYPNDKYSEIKTYQSEYTLSKDTIDIMTYNIGWLSGMTNNLPVARSVDMYHKNLNSFTSYLNNNNIDLIGFQEIDINSDRSFNYNQLDSISLNCSYHQSAIAVNWDKNYVPFPYTSPQHYFAKILSAQAIISKFPIVENSFETLIKPISAPFFYKDFYLERLIQKSIIKIGEKRITILNVHLEAFDEQTRNIHLQKSIEAIEFELQNGPLIFMGDLNSSQSPKGRNEILSKLIKIKGLSMAIGDEKFSNTLKNLNTYPSEMPTEKIDYIFFSNRHFDIVESKIITDFRESSDHLPVYAKLVLKN
jgi:endonuclease/exonuclease/phosphatase family metal-dependent hydrolase